VSFYFPCRGHALPPKKKKKKKVPQDTSSIRELSKNMSYLKIYVQTLPK
jgi:hypothetical protein